MRDPAVSNRKPAERRAGSRETLSSERRTQELLAIASRSRLDGKLAAARMSYDQVLRIDPENSEAHYWLAVIADDQGRYDDAERHYSILVKQNPRDPNVLASLGWSLLLQGRYDDSERTLRNALRYDPKHQTALYNLGWLYGTRGNYDQALATFRSAGSESDAQRAIAELRQNAPRSELVAAAEEPSTSRNISAPAPWTGGQTGGEVPQPAPSEFATVGSRSGNYRSESAAPAIAQSGNGSRGYPRPAPTQINGMFSEIDSYASSSPTQANQTREAESQSRGLGGEIGDPGVAPIQPGGMEPMNYEQLNRTRDGSQPPVITPRTAGAGMNGSKLGTTAWNSLPSASPLPAGAGSNNAPVSNSPVSNGSAVRNTGLPEWPGAVATGRPAAAPQAPVEMQGGRNPSYEAQIAAAQLGLGAGIG